jgi:hypothetical protein
MRLPSKRLTLIEALSLSMTTGHGWNADVHQADQAGLICSFGHEDCTVLCSPRYSIGDTVCIWRENMPTQLRGKVRPLSRAFFPPVSRAFLLDSRRWSRAGRRTEANHWFPRGVPACWSGALFRTQDMQQPLFVTRDHVA